jgi:CheY-like chemotaxis protein
VLVIDDDRKIAELIAGHLAPLEIRATTATSGGAALARPREETDDAITLDILMPGLDGFDVLRVIRADPKLRTIPILLVSVLSNRHELTGEWVVSKPIDADELRHVLSAAVAAGRSRVLVVGRTEMRPVLDRSLDELGCSSTWTCRGATGSTPVGSCARAPGRRHRWHDDRDADGRARRQGRARGLV